jgi:aspartate/glutamate racemase
MTKSIALLHTSPTVIPMFKALTDELLKGSAVFNMVDESLLRDIIRDKGLSEPTAARLIGHVKAAEQAGAEIILVSCSSMGRAVERSRKDCKSIVLRVDEPMAEKAIATGSRIGVIATLPSTLKPTVELIQERAAAHGKSVSIESCLVEGAFDAVISGNGAKHDELIKSKLKELVGRVDVVVLAQASMARVVDSMSPEEKPVPILSSPRLAVEKIRELING